MTPMERNPRRFQLVRFHDVTGVSGTGLVADGVLWPDGVAVLRWRGDFPTSVVFHDRGLESIRQVHGHGTSMEPGLGHSTELHWLDPDAGPTPTAQ